ncbi:MAG: helix-turn-helix domain-containing protein [Planctomycetes bacterium]|nr:helix-turn-helix domain-containing protein [Planctomycetota bacterium]
MNFAKRLLELRRQLFGDRGQRHFANYLGIPQSSLGKYEKSVSPNIQTIERIINKTGCNPNWLLLGEGRMFDNRYTNHEKQDNTSEGLNYLGNFSSDNFKWEPNPVNTKTIQIQNYRSDLYFAMSFKGEALEPEIKNGDICIFEHALQKKKDKKLKTKNDCSPENSLIISFMPYNRKIVLYKYNDVAEVRTMFIDTKKNLLYFIPFNNKFKPSVFTINDKCEFYHGNTLLQSLEIIGFLITVFRNYGRF